MCKNISYIIESPQETKKFYSLTEAINHCTNNEGPYILSKEEFKNKYGIPIKQKLRKLPTATNPTVEYYVIAEILEDGVLKFIHYEEKQLTEENFKKMYISLDCKKDLVYYKVKCTLNMDDYILKKEPDMQYLDDNDGYYNYIYEPLYCYDKGTFKNNCWTFNLVNPSFPLNCRRDKQQLANKYNIKPGDIKYKVYSKDDGYSCDEQIFNLLTDAVEYATKSALFPPYTLSKIEGYLLEDGSTSIKQHHIIQIIPNCEQTSVEYYILTSKTEDGKEKIIECFKYLPQELDLRNFSQEQRADNINIYKVTCTLKQNQTGNGNFQSEIDYKTTESPYFEYKYEKLRIENFLVRKKTKKSY